MREFCTSGSVGASGSNPRGDPTLLLRPASRHKAPQRARVECEISGCRRILEVAVVGREQIELVIAAALMSNPFAKDHRAQFQLPNLKPQLSFETADLRLHRRPTLLRGDRGPHPGPLAERHLDRVKAAPALQQFQEIFLEKCRIHAEFQSQRAAKPGA